ncbi:hypothetical protein DFH09DRAFT_1309470 [Mycena vulgaris]|nr:hypothetical protein DFH09DRAFT_1309470 [Mycena vulgaris]
MTILAHDLDVIAPPLMFSSPFSPSSVSMISRPLTSPLRYHPARHHPAPPTIPHPPPPSPSPRPNHLRHRLLIPRLQHIPIHPPRLPAAAAATRHQHRHPASMPCPSGDSSTSQYVCPARRRHRPSTPPPRLNVIPYRLIPAHPNMSAPPAAAARHQHRHPTLMPYPSGDSSTSQYVCPGRPPPPHTISIQPTQSSRTFLGTCLQSYYNTHTVSPDLSWLSHAPCTLPSRNSVAIVS